MSFQMQRFKVEGSVSSDVKYFFILRKQIEEEQRMMQEKEREEEERKLESERAAKEWREAVRLDAAEKLPPEPDQSEPHLLVKIRLPSGETVQRRFQKTNHIEVSYFQVSFVIKIQDHLFTSIII